MKKLFVLLVLLMTSFASASDLLLVQFRGVTPLEILCPAMDFPELKCQINSSFSLENKSYFLQPGVWAGIPCWIFQDANAVSTRAVKYPNETYNYIAVTGLRIMVITDKRYCNKDLCICAAIGETSSPAAYIFIAKLDTGGEIYARNVPNALTDCGCNVGYQFWNAGTGGTVYIQDMPDERVINFPDFGDMANCWQADLNDPNNPCWIWDIDADKQVGMADLAVWLSGWLIE